MNLLAILLVFVPAAIAAEFLHASPVMVFALSAGLVDLVKASITGSILGNLLLVLGAAQLAGGLRHKTQRFSVALAGLSISQIIIAVIGLVIPAIYHSTHVDPT